jgi:hypothetical protein
VQPTDDDIPVSGVIECGEHDRLQAEIGVLSAKDVLRRPFASHRIFENYP